MENVESLSHSLWECKYHLVWIPKCRKKTLYGPLRKYLGSLFKDLASQRECEIIEGHLLPDHVHILISIPPKYAVAQVVGFQGKECNSYCQDLYGTSKELHRPEFLGQGLLCFHGWQGRRNHQGIYQASRRGRSAY